MTHVLVTFLGAPDRGHPPTQHRRSGYQEIDYKFSDAEVYRARLSPLALLKFLRGKARRDDLVPPPDALVVFGTSGSAWHELMLCACGCWPDRDSIDRLVRRSHADSLTADDLNAFQDHDLLKSVLGVTSVRLELLPYADKAGEQVAIIAALNDAVKGAKTVTIDVTHGLRYLPLLGSLSAFVLMSGKTVKVEGVWYGALDMRKPDDLGQEQAPMIRLDGLSRIIDWLAAFKNFEWDGDFSGFVHLLKQNNLDADTANRLDEAAYAESLGDFEQAIDHVNKFVTVLSAMVVGGMTGLFKATMVSHLQRFSSEDFYQRQRRMVNEAVRRQDHQRVAIWASEAAITRITCQLKPSSVVRNRNAREAAVEKYKKRYNDPGVHCLATAEQHDQWKSYERLQHIRNAFAHTYMTKPPSDIATALQSEAGCMEMLKDAIKDFLTPDPNEKPLLPQQ